MKQFYVYLHFKPNGDLFYVGKGFGRRSHIFDSGRNQHHKNIVAKYGAQNIEVLRFDRDSEIDAVNTEILWIAVTRAEGIKLANISSGGEGLVGYKQAAETIEKIRTSNTGKKRSADQLRSMSLARKKLLSDRPELRAYTVEKIKAARFFVNEENRIAGLRRAGAEGRMSRALTPERKAKQLANMSTKEARSKMAQSKQKMVECITLNTVFDSVSDAAEATGLSISGVSMVCKGKRNSANKLKFCFV